MKPEIATTLAENRLIIVVDLLVADSARVDRWGVGVGRVEDHRLIRRVDPAVREAHLGVHWRHVGLLWPRGHVRGTRTHARKRRHWHFLRCHASS